jgi:hypothetical protein
MNDEARITKGIRSTTEERRAARGASCQLAMSSRFMNFPKPQPCAARSHGATSPEQMRLSPFDFSLLISMVVHASFNDATDLVNGVTYEIKNWPQIGANAW